MENISLKELRNKLDSKELSVAELVEPYTKRILETNDELNSFITVDLDHVDQHIKHAQAEIDNGNQSALTGVPFAVKDNFCTKGVRTTAASKILNDYVPPYSATAVNKIHDAVLLGKTNLDEFAMGSSTEFSSYGPTKNPYDLSRVPGGTSGGSAAAVASGQAPFTLGTDTGGSIRQPASFCNVVGLKPTYGRISRYGVAAMASSLDTVGIMANSVEDCAYVLQELAGADPLDSTTPDEKVDDHLSGLPEKITGLKIGVPTEYIEMKGLAPEVKKVFDEVVARVQGLGADIIEVAMPHTKYALPTYYIICPAEVSSNMSRYDGIQFGKPYPEATNLEEVFLKTREQGLGPEVKRRIMIGTFSLSSGYYDAYYRKAQKARTLIKEDFDEAFKQVDLLLTPTSPTTPFKIGERDKDPLAMYAADIFTAPASLAGMPALSLPAGFVDDLPVGVQFIAPQFMEKSLLSVASTVEEVIDVPNMKIAL